MSTKKCFNISTVFCPLTKIFWYPSRAHPCGTVMLNFCITSGIINLGIIIPPIIVMIIKKVTEIVAAENKLFEIEENRSPKQIEAKDILIVKMNIAVKF